MPGSTDDPQWDAMARLPGLRSVLDPGDTGGSRNRAIDRSQMYVLGRTLQRTRGSLILDLGCGVGRITTWLQTKGIGAVGVDSSSSMLSTARRGAPNASFVRGAASVLPFRDGAFDGIVSVYVLQYLVAQPAALKQSLVECRRVLRSGGRLAAIEQVNEGDRSCGGTLAAYLEGFRAAGFSRVVATPARLSDSRILEQVRRRPFCGRVPGIGPMISLEARSRHGRPIRKTGYADYLFVASNFRPRRSDD